MRLRVLGPLDVATRDGLVLLGAAKPRALLAALAIRRGSTCSTDELIDALWGESPPASASKIIQVYVSQVRKVLPPEIRIATSVSGYSLELDPSDFDVVLFERLLADGRAALRAGNPALASSTLARGLALWRGPAYADVRYETFALEEVERLERMRDLAVESRFGAELRLGRHAEVLGELLGLLATDPTQERIAVLAMHAAYRTSGYTEALAIFERVQAALAYELGEEPGPEVLALRDRMVRRDPTLEARPDDPAVAGGGPVLPTAPNELLGRRRELAELRSLLARPGVRLVSLTGAGGSGKSRLALGLARELEPTFANGSVLIELASLADASLVPATIARGFDLDPGRDALSTLRSALADREVLLVLDNFEHLRDAAPALVRLLAGAPHLTVVTTTRVVLHVSGEYVYPVAPLADADAVELFAQRARAQDPTFVLDPTTEPIVAAICRRLDGLPLPIELAAARVRSLGLRALDARLSSRLAILTGGPRDLPARQRTLRETLDWSANLLEPRHAQVFAALAVFAGSCSMEGAEVVAGADDEAMGTLVDHSLVQALDWDGERRYRLLETVREYAYERLGPRRAAVESELTTWIIGLVGGAALNSPGLSQVASLRRLDVELDVLRDALRHAALDEDPARELAAASGVWRYWWIRGHVTEGRAVLEAILERRGVVRTEAGARTAYAAASLAWSMGDRERATTLAQAALEAATSIGDVTDQLSAHNLLGVIATGRSDTAAAARHLEEAVRLAESVGKSELANTSRLNLGVAYLEAGRIDDARERFQTVLDDRIHEGLSEGVGFARLNLGETEYAAGDLDAAEVHFTIAVDAFRAVGFKVRHANALQGLAAVEARTGRAEAAAERLGVAATLMTDTGWGADGGELAPVAEAAAREALGDVAFERFFRAGADPGLA